MHLDRMAHALNQESISTRIRRAEGGETAATALKWLIHGIFGATSDDGRREIILQSAISILGAKNAIPLLLLAPFEEPTWTLVGLQ